MKKAALFATGFIACVQLNAQLGLSVTNLSGTGVITCKTPAITLSATSTYTAGPVSFLWTSPASATTAGSQLSAGNPGTYTVTASAGFSTATQTLVIGSNTIAPLSSVSPSIQNITCSLSGVGVTTITAISPSVNFSHKVLSPYGGTLVSYSSAFSYSASGAGTFTHMLTNTGNGCSTAKSFIFISSQGYPSFSLTASPDFSLGCSTASAAVVNIVNASATTSSQVPNGGPVSYTLLGPASSPVIPSGTLSATSGYTVNMPGVWTVFVRDNASLCTSRIPFTIVSNTLVPQLDTLYVSKSILTCAAPTATLRAYSSSPNTSYIWSFPTGSQPGSSLQVTANLSAPTQTLLGLYTVTAVDASLLGNQCLTGTVVTLYQNVFRPNALILFPGAPSISCTSPTVILTNGSQSGIPAGAFSNTLPVIAALWTGPAPALPSASVSTYTAGTGGTYTLLAKDLNNGCTDTDTLRIADTRNLPDAAAQGPFGVLCPNGTVNISALVSGSTANLVFQWQLPVGATASGISNATLAVSTPGMYTLTITNTLTSCAKDVQISVWACVGMEERNAAQRFLTIFPNPGNGHYTCRYEGDASGTELEITSSEGVFIKRQALVKGNNEIEITDQAPGIYIVYLRAPGKAYGHSKLVKQ